MPLLHLTYDRRNDFYTEHDCDNECVKSLVQYDMTINLYLVNSSSVIADPCSLDVGPGNTTATFLLQ